jgi:protein-S-isoprenylcysteine O-methyltransferase Ste14
MPRTALVAATIFGLLSFGWRGWLHRRQTGSSGFRGFSGAAFSREWWGGVLFAATMVLVPLGPLADLAGWTARIAAFDAPALRLLGLALFVVGGIATLWAQIAMGTSWRVGVDPTERTALVTAGPFGLVRNPIYSGMGAAFAGYVLLVPNALTLLTLGVLAVGIELHVRLVEEPYLLGVHGDAYRRWAAATGRFVPGVGRLR